MTSPGRQSSGSSPSSSQQQQQSSEDLGTQIQMMDERKRKRKLSNRESARRSRMRKQKHLDDLMAQVAHLRKENNQLLTTLNLTTQDHLTVESENSVLTAQLAELRSRLDSLNEIIGVLMNNSSSCSCNPTVASAGGYGGGGGGGAAAGGSAVIEDLCSIISESAMGVDGLMMNPWSSSFLNQPIMASANMFQY